MYTDYWKISHLPFENTPDPRFFYGSEKHQEALSRLQYLVRQKGSCGLLSGVFGCGKTLILRTLRQTTEHEGFKYAVVSNPRLDDLGLLRMILRGLTLHEVPASKADVLMALSDQLENIASDGKHTVIVIDEAHSIADPGVFEELRLLMNFQTNTSNLATLILAGQPDLRQHVDSNKQFNQRIALRYHLDAFSLEDTGKYLGHRLTVAGRSGEALFDEEAVKAIQKHSGGIPRWINHYAHMSLLTAFSKRSPAISTPIIEEAVQSLG